MTVLSCTCSDWALHCRRFARSALATLLAAVLAVGLIAGCSQQSGSRAGAQEDEANEDSPRVWLSRPGHDVGGVKAGTSHAITIRVENKGTDELTVAVGKIAGEITVKPTDLALAPGESESVTITVKAPREPGEFEASLQFKTNDPDNALVEWKVTGDSDGERRPRPPKPPTPNTPPAVAADPNLPHPKPGPEQPSLILDADKKNAGEIKRGKEALFRFLVKNEGDAEGRIHVRPGCGCTVTEYDEKIPPGKTGTIKAKLNTAGLRGKVSKSMTLSTNDADHEKVTLTISATIIPPIEVLPSTTWHSVLHEGESATQDFTLYANEGPALEIKSVREPSKKLDTELIPTDVEIEGKTEKRPGYILRVTIPDNLPARPFASTISLETNNKTEPIVNLTVSGKIQKEITVSPTTLYFVIRGEADKGAKRTMTVSKRTGAFEITKIDVGKHPLKARIVENKEQREYRVEFQYLGGWKPGFVNGIVYLHTNDKEQPKLEVPLTASVTKPTPKGGG